MKAVLLIGFVLASIHLAEAQQVQRLRKIGFLHSASADSISARLAAFRHGLQELGYVEGNNINVEYRFGAGESDRVYAAAADLVHLKVDVVVTGAASATRVAKTATTTIPNVMAAVSDPVSLGFVASVARPGNVTGLSTVSPEISGKRLELLKETIPGLSRLAVLGDSTDQDSARSLRETEFSARAFGVKHQFIELREPQDIEGAFREAIKRHADAVLVLPGTHNSQRTEVVRGALMSRLPAIYYAPEWLKTEGL